MPNFEIQGHCDEKFASVRDAFQKNFDDGLELGASFALTIEGEIVVDLWGGDAVADGSRKWERDTLMPVMSCSKTMCALCVYLLMDRGVISLHEPVATYWPEFAQGGKENVTPWHFLTHSSGLPGWDNDPDINWIMNWEQTTEQLAKQTPWWEPGAKTGYQVYTHGFLIGELVRRVTGKSIGTFFREEIGDPLDADFYIGLPESEFARLGTPSPHLASYAELEEGAGSGAFELYLRLTANLGATFFEDSSDPKWLQAEIPAGNGIANARGLAKAGSILANHGTLEGQHFVSENLAKLAWQEQIYVHDIVMEERVRYSLGFGLNSKEWSLPDISANGFHWGGAGGSGLIMCPDNRASWSYVPNLFYAGVPKDARANALTMAVAGALDG